MDLKTHKTNTLVRAGNHLVSIGRETSFVAILSPNTNDFVELSRAKTNKQLRKVKRKFKTWLNCDNSFSFEFMTNELTNELISTLKNK